MANVFEGDDGTVLVFMLTEEYTGIPLALDDKIVTIVMKTKSRRLVKDTITIDPVLGRVELTLDKEDLSESGSYQLQPIVKTEAGKEFAGTIKTLLVQARI